MNLEKALQVLGVFWSILAFIIAISFFFGGQWSAWVEIRDAHKEGNLINNQIDSTSFVTEAALNDYVKTETLNGYVKTGVDIYIQGPEGYLRSYNEGGRDELDVLINDNRLTAWKIVN